MDACRRTGRAPVSAMARGHESTPGHRTRTPAERRIRGATAGRRSTVIKMLKVIKMIKVIKCSEEKKWNKGKERAQ